MATSPVLLINSITLCLASASSPDVKMTVRGLAGEKSCIHSIGMLLIDFTSRAPAAISATISLEVRPFNAARERAMPAKAEVGFGAFMRVSRINQYSSTPINAFERLRHVHPFRG